MGGRPLLVLCSGNRLANPKPDAEVHLAAALRRHARVLFVDPPASPVGLRRRGQRMTWRPPRVRETPDGLLHLAPIVAFKPWSPPFSVTTAQLVVRQLRHAVREIGSAPCAVLTTWPYCDIAAAFPDVPLAYWWTDDPEAAAPLWRMDRQRLVDGDRRIADRADLVLAVSADAAARMRARGLDARFFPNGCDVNLLSRTQLAGTACSLTPPVAAFVGLLNARTDLALLEAVAASGQSLLIVGPRDPAFETQRLAALCARTNVAAIGPVPFAELPDVLGGVAVGIIPYADSPFNRASSPLKALEYLAAGRPVVSTSLPGVRWLATEHITLADTPAGFAAAVRAAARLPLTPATVAARRQFAAGHSWDHRADTLAQWLGISSPGAPPAGVGRPERQTSSAARVP